MDQLLTNPLSPASTNPRQLTLGGHLVLWLDAADDISDDTLAQALHDSERNLASEIVHPARRREFLRGRWLARCAFAQCDTHALSSVFSVGRTIHGAPDWPAGFAGSITHKNGHVAATVSRIDSTKPFCSVGIDLEQCGRVSEGVAERIMTPRDHAVASAVERAGSLTQDEWRALVFSAKEALYKCLFPIHHQQFWFEDAWFVSVSVQHKTFSVEVKEQFGSGATRFNGHYNIVSMSSGQRLVITMVTSSTFDFWRANA